MFTTLLAVVVGLGVGVRVHEKGARKTPIRKKEKRAKKQGGRSLSTMSGGGVEGRDEVDFTISAR